MNSLEARCRIKMKTRWRTSLKRWSERSTACQLCLMHPMAFVKSSPTSLKERLKERLPSEHSAGEKSGLRSRLPNLLPPELIVGILLIPCISSFLCSERRRWKYPWSIYSSKHTAKQPLRIFYKHISSIYRACRHTTCPGVHFAYAPHFPPLSESTSFHHLHQQRPDHHPQLPGWPVISY